MSLHQQTGNDYLEYVQQQQSPPVVHAFGCRKPESAEGKWDAAFVYVKDENGKQIYSEFQRGMDFIGHPESALEAARGYTHYIEKGWKPMTVEDIEKTTGVTCSNNVSMVVPTE